MTEVAVQAIRLFLFRLADVGADIDLNLFVHCARFQDTIDPCRFCSLFLYQGLPGEVGRPGQVGPKGAKGQAGSNGAAGKDGDKV